MHETPDQIADRLMAPGTSSALWTYDQVRRLIIEAAESAPLSAGERKDAWAALRMISDAMGELFGPLASVAEDDHRPSREYHHEAERIIVALRHIADRLALIEAERIVGPSIKVVGENWTGAARETAADMAEKIKAIAPSGGQKGSGDR